MKLCFITLDVTDLICVSLAVLLCLPLYRFHGAEIMTTQHRSGRSGRRDHPAVGTRLTVVTTAANKVRILTELFIHDRSNRSDGNTYVYFCTYSTYMCITECSSTYKYNFEVLLTTSEGIIVLFTSLHLP